MAFGMGQAMPSSLRLYGHPQLLAIAENINGQTSPFNDAILIKQPGVGGSVAWHQDGPTQWNSPAWDEGIHGFNFLVQLYGATAGNGLRGGARHAQARQLDIKAMLAESNHDRLPDAIPLVCQPGDETLVNRQRQRERRTHHGRKIAIATATPRG